MIMSATTDKSELSLEFGHIVAYSKMTLTNLDEDIESVTITAADDILLATSASTIALDAQNVTPSVTAGSGSEAGTVSTYEATLWFTSLPSELSYFNIAANYTRGHASEKEILASSPLTLTGGHLTPFSVAMPEPGLILDRQSTTITMTNSRAVATDTVLECDFTAQDWSNGEVVSSVELSDNQGNTITLTLAKEASQSSSPAYYTGSLRLYRNSTLTIASSQKIYSVEITSVSSSYNGTETMYVTKNSSKSWTLCNYTSAASYTQLRMTSIKITLAEPSADDDAEQSDSTTTDDGAVDTSAGSTAGTGSTSLGYDESGTSIDTSVPHWLELPAVYPNDDLAFYTHPMTIDGTVTRNYSFDWCPEEHVSYWVAYPLNSWLIGTGSRTNNWAYDPLVPESEQAYLKSAYNKDDDGTSYDRGHQLPSADRYNGTSNDETFYFTNMTPQISSFNQGIWAKLEDKVRTWALEEAVDTMYVVTGAYMKDYTVSTTDKKGTAMPVPVAYYKALLVKSTGSSAISGNVGTSSGGYYIGGAFYLEHKTYSSTAITTSYTLSIDELEAKVGIDFFVNLPDLIGTANAASVEAMKPSETTFWGL